MTWGAMAAKMNATAQAMPARCAAKAGPVRPARVSAREAVRLTAVRTSGAQEAALGEWASCAHRAHAAVTAVEAAPQARARASARSDRAPRVLSAVKSAPWVRNSRQVTAPPRRVKGVSRLRKPPVSWWEAPLRSVCAGTRAGSTTAPSAVRTTSMRMPWTRLAKATPHRTEGIQALIVWAQSQASRQARELILLRHSMAQTRTIRHSRMRNRAR